MRAITAELARRASERGLQNIDAQMLALATLTGWTERREAANGQSLFGSLGESLPEGDHGSGATAARDWLLDPGLSSREWDVVDDNLRFLKETAVGPVDWNAEAAHCLAGDARSGLAALSMQLARSIGRVIDLPLHGSIGCLFTPSVTLAWILAEEHDVTVYADQQMAITLALLSRAACRSLTVRRENPIDGSFSPAPYAREDRSAPFDSFDFLVSIPPFGARVQDGPNKGMAFESYQSQFFAERARAAFYTLVPDGALFREVEAKRRECLVSEFKTTVLSLPAGMLLPAASVSTCLLRLERGRAASVRVIDGRAMETLGPGRPQETLISQHLEAFRGLRIDDPERTATVSMEELADNGFSLLPDRYVKSAGLAAIEKALELRPAVALGDIADIERGKAPMPLREPDDSPPLVALEIAPSDLVDGVVRTPVRQQAFDAKEQARVKGVTVRASDILVSIKGNVGNVGIVEDPGVHLAHALDEPWIVSQSLAIVRLKPNPHIQSSAILAALLTAPWVREKLESMSGASTVRTLPLSALRSLTLPVPTAGDCARAETALAEIACVREQIAEHQRNLVESRRQLWAQLWQIPEDFGDQ